MRIEFNAELIRQALHIRRRIQPYGQDYQIEFLFLYTVIRCGVSDGNIFGLWDLSSDGYIASYESSPGKIFRPLIESFEVFAECPNIIMEYGALRIRVMIFCKDHLFLCVSTAYGRTITVTAFEDLSGTDALNPGNSMGVLQVGRT